MKSDTTDAGTARARHAQGLGLMAQLGFVVLAAVLVYSFVLVTMNDGEYRRRCIPACQVRAEYVGADKRAPNFTLKNMKGQTVSLDSYRGKVVVLNFWTKTCGPCLKEMPELAELAKVFATTDRDDAVVLTVSTDEGPEDVASTLRAVLRGDAPFPVLFDSENAIVRGKYGTKLFPETWIIDKRGVIRARFDGARNWTDPVIVEFIDQLRNNEYCPVEIKSGEISGKPRAIEVCTEVGG